MGELQEEEDQNHGVGSNSVEAGNPRTSRRKRFAGRRGWRGAGWANAQASSPRRGGRNLPGGRRSSLCLKPTDRREQQMLIKTIHEIAPRAGHGRRFPREWPKALGTPPGVLKQSAANEQRCPGSS